MEVRSIVRKNHVHYPVDGSWPGDESKVILSKAKDKAKELSRTHPYVVLIASSHWASEGYWIEFKEPKILLSTDIIVVEHKTQILDEQRLPEDNQGS